MADNAMTLSERLKSRSMRELDRIDAEARRQPTQTRVQKKKKKKKQKERIGVGRDDSQSNAQRLISRLRSQATAAEDPGQKAELEARIKAIQATVSE